MRRTGRVPASRRSKLSAAAGPDCAAAFQEIALDCVAGIRAWHRRACAGDAEAVHQVRVAITRLRAVVSFFKPIAVDTEWAGLEKEIVWLNGALGAVRDGDVMAAHGGVNSIGPGPGAGSTNISLNAAGGIIADWCAVCARCDFGT